MELTFSLRTRFQSDKLIRVKLEGGGTYVQNVGDLSNSFHVFFFLLLFQLGICGKEVSLMADRQ